MAETLTSADVAQAEAALAEAKASDDPEVRQRAANECVAVRSAFRQQEVDAGRRAAGPAASVQED
jgi:hypothetical protein